MCTCADPTHPHPSVIWPRDHNKQGERKHGAELPPDPRWRARIKPALRGVTKMGGLFALQQHNLVYSDLNVVSVIFVEERTEIQRR